jgi:hypothetical protein
MLHIWKNIPLSSPKGTYRRLDVRGVPVLVIDQVERKTQEK